jgi:hypothetical protein
LVSQPQTPDNVPQCTSPGQANCIDPVSGLYVIGSVTVHMTTDSLQMGWSSTGDGHNPNYLSGLYHFAQKFGVCLADSGFELASTAFAIATYLAANGSKFASATADLQTYVGVYLIGGATDIELIGAVMSVLSAGDFALLLGALGLTIWQVAREVHCVAVASAPE